MGLQYVVAKRVFGFDKEKKVKYVAKSVGTGGLDFDKLCAKVSRILGIHRKTVDLVAAGLVDIMSEEIDDGKTVRLGDFGCSVLLSWGSAPIRKPALRRTISFASVLFFSREKLSIRCWDR